MGARTASNYETRAAVSPAAREKQSLASPRVIFVIITCAIFAVEFGVMLLNPWLGVVPQAWAALLDATALTLLLLPFLYFVLWRPLKAQIDAAQHAEEMLRIRSTALESAAHGVIITTREGEILWSNPAFTRMTGYSAEEVRGKTPQLLKSDRHDPSFFSDLWNSILAGRVWHGETVNRRKDGSTYIEEQTVAPVFDAAGKITHFVAIKYDCTLRKIAESDLAQRNAELLALSTAERKQRELAEALARAAAALNSSLDRDEVLDRILEQTQKVVRCAAASVVLVQGEELVVVRRRVPDGATQNPDEIISINQHPRLKAIIDTRRPYVTADLLSEPDMLLEAHRSWIRSMVACPLLENGGVLGLLMVLDAAPGRFDQESLQALSAFAAHAEAALRNARLFEEVQAGRERMRSLSRHLVEVQENERRYVARELHDEAGQALTLLKFGLSNLEHNTSDPACAVKVADLRKINDDVIENIHRLAVSLRPASLDRAGLVLALSAHVQRLDEQNGPSAHFKAVGFDGERLPSDIETALYRLATEALTNVLRHANATQVDVLLQRSAGKVLLIVEDDGQGFDTQAVNSDTHLGLLGMRERCRMFGGALHIESTPGSGTTIVGELPLADSHSRGG